MKNHLITALVCACTLLTSTITVAVESTTAAQKALEEWTRSTQYIIVEGCRQPVPITSTTTASTVITYSPHFMGDRNNTLHLYLVQPSNKFWWVIRYPKETSTLLDRNTKIQGLLRGGSFLRIERDGTTAKCPAAKKGILDINHLVKAWDALLSDFYRNF